MQNTRCRKCGDAARDGAACPDCGRASVNGAAKPKGIKPPPPPELAGRVFEPVPPEVADEFRRTFNEAEFLAEMEEAIKTGGADVDALIARIERKVHGGD